MEVQKDFKDSEFAGKEHYRSEMIKIYRSLGMKKSDYESPCKACRMPFSANCILKHIAHSRKCIEKYSEIEIEALKEKSADIKKKKDQDFYQANKDKIAAKYKHRKIEKKRQLQIYKNTKYLRVKSIGFPTVSNISSNNITDVVCKICKKVMKINTIMKHLANSFNCKENYNLKDLKVLREETKKHSMCKKSDWKKQHYSSATRSVRYQQNKNEIAKNYQNNKSEISKKSAAKYDRQLRKEQRKDREEKHRKLVDAKIDCEFKKWRLKCYNDEKDNAKRKVSDCSSYQRYVDMFKQNRSFPNHITQGLVRLEVMIADKFKKLQNETFKVFREIEAVLGPLGPCNQGDDENHFKDIMFCNLDFFISFEKQFLNYHIKDKLKEIASELGDVLEEKFYNKLEEEIRFSKSERLKKTDAERLHENENGFYATKNHLKLSFENIKRSNYSSDRAWRIAVAKKCSVEFCSCHYGKNEEFDLSNFSISRLY